MAAPDLDSPFATLTQPRQLSDEVASYIREAILSGQVPGGASLTIDGLARELGVSATPVREALLALRGEGFVAFQRRRGFTAARMTLTDLIDVYWMQSVIAGELARRATERADTQFLERVKDLQKRIESALDDGQLDRVEMLNFELHREINRVADAPKLRWMLRLLLRYVPHRFYGNVPGWAEASAQDHAGIMAAMQLGQADTAREAMAAHIHHAGDLLVANLRRRAQ